MYKNIINSNIHTILFFLSYLKIKIQDFILLLSSNPVTDHLFK